MNQPLSTETLSRIDKLFMDSSATLPGVSRSLRAKRGLYLRAGEDVRNSYGLQLALLTAVNLGVKCFAGEAMVNASADLCRAPCLVPVVRAATMGDAIVELGGKLSVCNNLPQQGRYLILGDVENDGNAVRVTYDGWRIAVGPASEVPRMAERPYCALASIAAAAIAVGEVFADFAGISITATRRVVTLSLWRPDLPSDHPDGAGEQILELPLTLGIFGLGHLGQAYLWGLSSLRYPSPNNTTFLLCDDDVVEEANVETGALLKSADVALPKTRVAAKWLEERGFSTKLLERKVDSCFRRTAEEPVIALSGFDNNNPRQWLSMAGFTMIFDSGLGGEAHNFDTIAFHAWPNPRSASDIWPLESDEELSARESRKRKREKTANNEAYQALGGNECGRLLIAGKSVAVPFVGAMASCIVLAELLKTVNGGPIFSDLKLRVCSTGTGRFEGLLASEIASPIRGLSTAAAKGHSV
jgi:hypothetical protein